MNQTHSLPIVISSGHTGGHFFPALTFAKSLKKSHPEVQIHFLLGRVPAFAETAISDAGFQTQVTQILPFPKFFSFKMLLFLLRYPCVYFETWVYLRNIKPSLVVGFGSFASVPSVLCAAALSIPTLLHEQNFMAGRANRFLSLFASKIAVSFPDTKGIGPKNKTLLTGYPLREEFSRLSPRETRDRFNILVFGGSQGARRLNQIFLESMERLNGEEKKEIAVKHIAGNEDLNRIQSFYQQSGIRAEVSAFSHCIAEDYQSADLIISRSGAGTVFELIAAARSAVLIPYPHAYAHQRLNADYLTKRQAAVVIMEENLSPETLTAAILNLKRDVHKRAELIRNLRTLNQPNAVQALVEAAWELACRKN